ncbi:MAG: aminoacyl-tRNA hydrolase [Candidatus Marinimicrobia bacterium]|nr:aminoacyl-tRNA hydrolase [Candidatus Neomarinimicrobiota bacterium]
MPRAIIGLGNPGERYAKTRHNAGFMVVDELAQRWQVTFRPGKGSYVFAKSPQWDAVLMKPATYMNHSGQAVRHLTDYFKIDPMDCMLVFDDLDIPFPEIRFRKQGGAGTHRGMQSVITHLNTPSFPRTRMGIGGSQGRRLAEDFVLENYLKVELDILSEQLGKAVDALEYWLKEDIDNTMNRFNVNPRKAVTEDIKEEN